MATLNELPPGQTEDQNARPDNDGFSGEKPGHSARHWLVFLILLICATLAVIFFGWLPRHKRTESINQEAKERTEALPRVQVQRVKRAPPTSELAIPGTTLPYTEAHIYARASGYVTRRLVDIGDHVRAGQLLASIDSPDLDRQVAQEQASLRQSEASLGQLRAQQHLAQVTWDRWKVLVGRGVFSKQEGDQQEANYRVAEANVAAGENLVQSNRENLNRLKVLQEYERVTAPFAGVITARNIDVGALISSSGSGLGAGSPASTGGISAAGAQGNNQGASGNVSSNVSTPTGAAQGGEMFSIASVDRLRILVSVPEAYTSSIKVGQPAVLSFQERPNEQVRGRVTRTSASINQNTRTLLVEVQVANNGRLVPGMYVLVSFRSTNERPPIIIPGASIVIRGAKTTVAVVEDQTVHFRPITVGRDYGELTEVTSGLGDGDVIALDVTDEIRDGLKVASQFATAPNQQPGSQTEAKPGQGGNYGSQGLADQPQSKSKGGGGNGGSHSSNSGK
jgi:multidrug efflux pump subunit AcrA (membrane-fusion protein)